MENKPEIGLAQPLITRYPEKNRVNSFGNAFHFLGFGYSFGDNWPIGQLYQKYGQSDYEPAYLSFTAVVVRRAVFEQIGLLDERYFAYHEDSDLFSLRLTDWHLWPLATYCPSSYFCKKERYFWLEKIPSFCSILQITHASLAFPAWLLWN